MTTEPTPPALVDALVDAIAAMHTRAIDAERRHAAVIDEHLQSLADDEDRAARLAAVRTALRLAEEHNALLAKERDDVVERLASTEADRDHADRARNELLDKLAAAERRATEAEEHRRAPVEATREATGRPADDYLDMILARRPWLRTYVDGTGPTTPPPTPGPLSDTRLLAVGNAAANRVPVSVDGDVANLAAYRAVATAACAPLERQVEAWRFATKCSSPDRAREIIAAINRDRDEALVALTRCGAAVKHDVPKDIADAVEDAVDRLGVAEREVARLTREASAVRVTPLTEERLAPALRATYGNGTLTGPLSLAPGDARENWLSVARRVLDALGAPVALPGVDSAAALAEAYSVANRAAVPWAELLPVQRKMAVETMGKALATLPRADATALRWMLSAACDAIDQGWMYCSDCDRGPKADPEWRAAASPPPMADGPKGGG